MALMLIEGVILLFEKQRYMLKREMVIRKAKILLPVSARHITLSKMKPCLQAARNVFNTTLIRPGIERCFQR